MEIRLQSRQTGITTWLISEAVQHALDYPKSINYLLYPSMAQRDYAWNAQCNEIKLHGGRKGEAYGTKSIVFDNNSVIEFITTNFIMQDKKMFGYGMQFIFVDNLEMFYPSNAGINKVATIPFSDSDDMFIGGTDMKDGVFRIVIDYKEFCRTHDMRQYLREFYNIHDFIVGTDFLKNDAITSYCPYECESCRHCDMRNRGCLRLGNFFAVGKRCPLYVEMMVHSLNNNIDRKLEWILSGK